MAGVNKRPVKTGTDWSRYTPIFDVSTINTAVSGVYETAYSVTGKGFLSDLYFVDVTDAGDVRVTIDGVVIFTAGSSSVNDPCGITQFSHLLTDPSTEAISVPRLNMDLLHDIVEVRDYPYTGGNDGAWVILSEPLFFNTSLLIEVKGDAGNNVGLRVSGGYIA